MSVQVNPPPQLRIPKKIFDDPELLSYFENLGVILWQLWNRTGGGTDSITYYSDHVNLSSIGANTHAQIDTHIGLVNEHIDWTADQGAVNINPGNYVDTDTTDHTLFSNIGTNTHAQIDTHISNLSIHLVTSTTAALEDITDSINTGAAKELGYMVLNTDTGLTVFASGNTDGAVWHYYDESTAHTPV